MVLRLRLETSRQRGASADTIGCHSATAVVFSVAAACGLVIAVAVPRVSDGG